MNAHDYEPILRAEFAAEPNTFLIRLRCELVWDRVAFSRLVSCMEACAVAHVGVPALPRWIAEGFWYCGYFVQEWSSHPDFPREHSPDYYAAAYERLRDLAYLLFIGKSPRATALPPL